jgi:hypothetical protein
MIALAVQIRILFLVLLAALALYGVWRLWQRAAHDARLREALPLLGRALLRRLWSRGAIPLLWVLLRVLRGLR